MRKLIYKNNDFELHEWDIVELKNGMIVGVIGSEIEYDTTNENTKLFISTSPISSQASSCYVKHVQSIIYKSGCFENYIEYMFNHLQNNPLQIELKYIT